MLSMTPLLMHIQLKSRDRVVERGRGIEGNFRVIQRLDAIMASSYRVVGLFPPDHRTRLPYLIGVSSVA